MKLEDRLNEAGTPIGIHRVSFKGDVVNNIAEKDSRTEAREAIYKDLTELVGADKTVMGLLDTPINIDAISKASQNNLRAELRNKLKGYCGVEG